MFSEMRPHKAFAFVTMESSKFEVNHAHTRLSIVNLLVGSILFCGMFPFFAFYLGAAQ